MKRALRTLKVHISFQEVVGIPSGCQGEFYATSHGQLCTFNSIFLYLQIRDLEGFLTVQFPIQKSTLPVQPRVVPQP